MSEELKIPEIIEPSKLVENLKRLYAEGYRRGQSTGWKILDQFYTVVPGQLCVTTGIPSHGKSEFLDALLMNLAQAANWNFVIYSPENWPVELHAQKLAEKFTGKPLLGKDKMLDFELCEAADFINEHFSFINCGEYDLDLKKILQITEKIKKIKRVDGLIIDPYNELETTRPNKVTETEFIGGFLKSLRLFARKNNLAVWVVAHPVKLRKENGKYPIPTLYDINGSANWFNKCDVGLVVWRNFESDFTEVHIQKVKFKYFGQPGTVRFTYNKLSGCYEEKPVF